MMKLRINPIVAEDLKNIKEYIAEDNEEMAVKTIQEIYARIENIQQFPYIGADLAKRVSFRTDYKYVICGNYVVLYKIGKEYVEIYRVVNRYQDITKIFLSNWCCLKLSDNHSIHVIYNRPQNPSHRLLSVGGVFIVIIQ